jgi:uncharacterized protein YkwD
MLYPQLCDISYKMSLLAKNKSGLIRSIIATLICFAIFLVIFYVALPATVNTRQVETDIFRTINRERANEGLPELDVDVNLESIAGDWSKELIAIGILTHGNFEQRIASIGYSYYSCGEIIAEQNGWSWTLARDFVDSWINSPPHYEIMMTNSHGYIGVGVSKDGNTFYAVVDFRFT